MYEVLTSQTAKHVVTLPRNQHDTVRQYITSDTGEVPPFTKFISDEVYREALSGVVVKCIDIMVYDPDTGRMLIGTRDQEPQAGDWVIGGRKRAGESDEDAAVNNLRRELHLEVDPEKLTSVGTQYDMIWDTREQAPDTNEEGKLVTGVHQSSTLMALPLTERNMHFNEEYSGLHWVDPDEVMSADPGTYHPALVDMVHDTYERITRPDPPKDLSEAHVRAVGQLATIEANMRALER